MRLDGKVAIITGAASGIGKATTELFRREGAVVIAADLTEGEGLVRADAACEDDVRNLIALARANHGGLDIMFANAGIPGSLASVLDATVAEWEAVLRVNLISAFLAIKHAGPALRERGGGAIICTASAAGLRSGAGGAAYSASKAGIINLVKLAATQLCDSNIRVNAIAPGLIETGMTSPIYAQARERGKEASIGRANPLKRGGEAEEIARTALFLASSDASYINGQTLAVDGGLSASHPFQIQQYGRTTL